MNTTHRIVPILIVFLFPKLLLSQVKIVSSSFSSYNVSAENMCSLNVSNAAANAAAWIEARIVNVQGNSVIKVVTSPFNLKNGVFNTSQMGLNISSVVYQNTTMAEYIRLYHQLPSGKYIYMVSIHLNDGEGDELSEEIESESSSFLTLVNPPDKDTVETSNPILLWTHSESFNLIQQGEYYKIMVAEIKPEQSAESAINVNNPLYQLNFLTRHDVLYPFDAPRLNEGRYAWQVQKVANGVITNKTEAWEFVVKSMNKPDGGSFVEITPKLNINPYTVENGKIYFVFKEEYAASIKDLRLIIVDNKGKETPAKAKYFVPERLKENRLKISNNDHYELNLQEAGIYKSGYYTLKILNEKSQEFLLKFTYNL